MSTRTLLFAAFLFNFSTIPVLGQAQGFLGIRAKKGDTLDQCATIELLAPGSPSERAGLAPGDAILSINGVAVDCANIQKGTPIVPRVKGGERVVFSILRAGKTLELAVTAESLPVEIVQAQEERPRMEAGRAIFQKLARTQEVFTVTLLKDGGFKLSGKLAEEELELLHFYFAKGREGAMFHKVMTTESQDMYLRFEPGKGYQFEFVDASSPAPP